ncbi:MAG: glutamate synthase, partial [Pseudomonadota bacterium]
MIPPVYAQPREKLAPCRASCPCGIDIRGWINIIAQREKTGIERDEAIHKAWLKLVEFNPLPAVLGRVCPHPCEDECNRKSKEGAVSIHTMERFIGDWALEHRFALPVLENSPKAESIGIIGSGPAGLS